MAKGPIKPPDWHKAAIAGDDATISWLLADGQSVDSLDGYGQTALMLAACHGHLTTVALLLGHGAALDVTAKHGLSALMLAVVNHHDGVARRLVASARISHHAAPGRPSAARRLATWLRVQARSSSQPILPAPVAPKG